MQHRHVFEAVDRSLHDIRQDEWPFGGIVMCFCGDFLSWIASWGRNSRRGYSSDGGATLQMMYKVRAQPL
jgi:hypothetical protein